MNRKSSTPTFILVTGYKNDRGRQEEYQEMQERDSNNSPGLEIYKEDSRESHLGRYIQCLTFSHAP